MPTPQDRVRDTRQRDWGWFNYSLLDTYGPLIKADGIAVYVALVRHADNATQTCHPSYETLAGETGLSRRQVMRVIERLATVGLLRVTPQSTTTTEGKRVHAANRYTLLALDVAPVAEAPAPRPAPVVVTASHQGSDTQSPKQDSTDKTQSEQEREIPTGEGSALAPAPDGEGDEWPAVTVLDRDALCTARYLAFAQGVVPGVRVDGTWLAAEFAAYRDSVADRGKRSADWGAGWRAWLRRVRQFEPGQRGRASPPPAPLPLTRAADNAEVGRRRAKEARTA